MYQAKVICSILFKVWLLWVELIISHSSSAHKKVAVIIRSHNPYYLEHKTLNILKQQIFLMIERPTYSVLKHSKYCLIVFLPFNSCCGQSDSNWGCWAFQFKREKWDVYHSKTRSTFISGQRQDRHLRQILTGESSQTTEGINSHFNKK